MLYDININEIIRQFTVCSYRNVNLLVFVVSISTTNFREHSLLKMSRNTWGLGGGYRAKLGGIYYSSELGGITILASGHTVFVKKLAQVLLMLIWSDNFGEIKPKLDKENKTWTKLSDVYSERMLIQFKSNRFKFYYKATIPFP